MCKGTAASRPACARCGSLYSGVWVIPERRFKGIEVNPLDENYPR